MPLFDAKRGNDDIGGLADGNAPFSEGSKILRALDDLLDTE